LLTSAVIKPGVVKFISVAGATGEHTNWCVGTVVEAPLNEPGFVTVTVDEAQFVFTVKPPASVKVIELLVKDPYPYHV
jgi:glutamine synthetase type III